MTQIFNFKGNGARKFTAFGAADLTSKRPAGELHEFEVTSQAGGIRIAAWFDTVRCNWMIGAGLAQPDKAVDWEVGIFPETGYQNWFIVRAPDDARLKLIETVELKQ